MPEDNLFLDKVSSLRGQVVSSEQRQDDFVLCHNDLQAGHVLSLAPTMVIDWEYAAMGNRYFDIASCAVINNYDDERIQRLCKSYASKSNIDERIVLDETKRHCTIVEVTNALWFAALEANET